jgi:hypothetical protein
MALRALFRSGQWETLEELMKDEPGYQDRFFRWACRRPNKALIHRFLFRVSDQVYSSCIRSLIAKSDERFVIELLKRRSIKQDKAWIFSEALLHNHFVIRDYFLAQNEPFLWENFLIGQYFEYGHWDLLERFWPLVEDDILDLKSKIREQFLTSSAKNGRLDWVKTLLPYQDTTNYGFELFDAIGAACENGHLDVVEYLHPTLLGANAYYTNETIRKAIKNGHQSILNYWLDHYFQDNEEGRMCGETIGDFLEIACIYQHQNIALQLLQNIRHQDSKIAQAIIGCLENNALEMAHFILDYVKDQDFLGQEHCLEAALKIGDMPLIQRLIERLKQFSPTPLRWDDYFIVACQSGQLETAKYCLSFMDYFPQMMALDTALMHEKTNIFEYFSLYVSDKPFPQHQHMDHLWRQTVKSYKDDPFYTDNLRFLRNHYPPYSLLLKQLIIEALTQKNYPLADFLGGDLWNDPLLHSVHWHFFERQEAEENNPKKPPDNSVKLNYLLSKRTPLSTYCPIYDVALSGTTQQLALLYDPDNHDPHVLLTEAAINLNWGNILYLLPLANKIKPVVKFLQLISRVSAYFKQPIKKHFDYLHQIFEHLDPKKNPEMLRISIRLEMTDWVERLKNQCDVSNDRGLTLNYAVDKQNKKMLDHLIPSSEVRADFSRCLRLAIKNHWVEGMIALMPHSNLDDVLENEKMHPSYHEAYAWYERLCLHQDTSLAHTNPKIQRL